MRERVGESDSDGAELSPLLFAFVDGTAMSDVDLLASRHSNFVCLFCKVMEGGGSDSSHYFSEATRLLALCGKFEQSFGRPLLSAVITSFHRHPLLSSSDAEEADDSEGFISLAVAQAVLRAFRPGATVLSEDDTTTVALVITGVLDVRVVRTTFYVSYSFTISCSSSCDSVRSSCRIPLTFRLTQRTQGGTSITNIGSGTFVGLSRCLVGDSAITTSTSLVVCGREDALVLTIPSDELRIARDTRLDKARLRSRFMSGAIGFSPGDLEPPRLSCETIMAEEVQS